MHAIVEEGKESLWVSIYTSACNSGGGEGVFVVSIYILVHAIVEEGKESL